ncbi:ArsR/SmtB family transcription factor [Oryzobacter terrae]|uniref:ArsR/SmtB family transcription factor n=1 Tax=Oryzobacter terrae TaxID=1620385 RepID=UPI0036704C97
MATNGSDALAVLGDATRRAIVERLAEQPASVGELASVVPVSRPAVSQHLKVLREAGLVSERAVGTRRVYRLEPLALAALRDQIDTFWRRALESYDEAAAAAAGAGAGDARDERDVEEIR